MPVGAERPALAAPTGPPSAARVHSDADEAREAPELLIEPTRGWVRFDLGELWRYRDLLYFLTRRDIALRYKQTTLGVLWAVVQPLLTMVIFTIFLGRLARVPSDEVPYPIFVYVGLLPWTYFAGALTRSGASLVGNANLVSKVYFPRVLIPLSATLSALVDFAISCAILLVLMGWYRVAPGHTLALLPALIVLTAVAALGVGMGLSALNVRYRDVQYAIPFLLQVWMYATPVVYPASLVPHHWRVVFALNPMAGIIESYRASLLNRPVPWTLLGVSTAATLAIAVLGAWQFRRMERTFADIV